MNKPFLLTMMSILAYILIILFFVFLEDAKKCTIDHNQYLKIFEACVPSVEGANSSVINSCQRSAVKGAEICVY